MCGRYSLVSPPSKVRLVSPFSGDESLIQMRFNIAPTQSAPVVVSEGMLKAMRWGLTPPWSRAKVGATAPLINARSETVGNKAVFARLLRRQRCVVPADGFYEWQRRERGKQPYRFRLKSQEPFVFAGLWDCDQSPGQPPQDTFVILTTQANAVVGPLHDRMPVILTRNQVAQWLEDKEFSAADVKKFSEPLADGMLECYPVTPQVNRPQFNGPECIKPLAAVPGNLELDLGMKRA